LLLRSIPTHFGYGLRMRTGVGFLFPESELSTNTYTARDGQPHAPASNSVRRG
jgi:hypothetical protein